MLKYNCYLLTKRGQLWLSNNFEYISVIVKENAWNYMPNVSYSFSSVVSHATGFSVAIEITFSKPNIITTS